MIKLDGKCIVCRSEEISTVISIMLNDEKYEVGLCSEHDGISIKEIHDLINKYNEAINNLNNMVVELGYIMIKDDIESLKDYVDSLGYRLVKKGVEYTNHVENNTINETKLEQESEQELQTIKKDGIILQDPIKDPRQKRKDSNNIVVINNKMIEQNTNNVLESFNGAKLGDFKMIDCPNCDGNGFIGSNVCERCGGSGQIVKDITEATPEDQIQMRQKPVKKRANDKSNQRHIMRNKPVDR